MTTIEAYDVDPQVRAARTWDGQQAKATTAGHAPASFRARLTATVQQAVLIGGKWMIVAVLSLWAIGWVLGDYAVVRERALHGQQGFEYLQQQVAAQQKAAKPGQP